MIRYPATIAACAFMAAAVLTCTGVEAQEQLTPTHQARVGPTQVLYRFAEQAECVKGEFLVAHTDVATQRVIKGCAHQWGDIHFVRFEDGDIGALDIVKWVPVGKGS